MSLFSNFAIHQSLPRPKFLSYGNQMFGVFLRRKYMYLVLINKVIGEIIRTIAIGMYRRPYASIAVNPGLNEKS